MSGEFSPAIPEVTSPASPRTNYILKTYCGIVKAVSDAGLAVCSTDLPIQDFSTHKQAVDGNLVL